MCNSKLSYSKNEEGRYVCPHCTYTARIQSTMHYHLKRHLGDLPFECTECAAKFTQKSMLELHMTTKHKQESEKEVFECPCSDCDYKDYRKGNRLIHFVRVHLKEITSKLKSKSKEEGCVATCTECQKDFKSMTQFYYHAASCISLPDNHLLSDSWNKIK